MYQHVHFEQWLKMEWLILQLCIFMLLIMHIDIKTVFQLQTERKYEDRIFTFTASTVKAGTGCVYTFGKFKHIHLLHKYQKLLIND